MQINTATASVATATANGTPPKRKQKAAEEAAPSAELMDTFTQETIEQGERRLRMEHKARLAVDQQLHLGRIATIFAQLHSQLFAMWNEVWMQRKKVHDDAFKAWLKLMSA